MSYYHHLASYVKTFPSYAYVTYSKLLEVLLLLYFVSNRNRVLSKTNLAEYMSSKYFDYGFSDDVIYGHIKNLKKKLEKHGAQGYIKNVYGVGYKFIVE